MIKTLSSSEEIKNFLGIEPLQAASIRVTMACNLNCQQCYAIAGKRLKNELSFREIKKLLNDLKNLGAIRLFFTGGEPFLRPDLTAILNYADKLGFVMYISTNGTLLNQSIIKKMSNLKHLRTFQISIDGLGDTHDKIRGVKGTFNNVLSNIKLVKQELKNTNAAIISTLMRSNYNQMEKLLDFAIDVGVDTFGIVTLYPVKRSNNANDVSTIRKYRLFQKLARIYKSKNTSLKIGLLIPPALIPESLKEIEYGCGYVCSFPSLLGINANGDVAPCDGLLNYKNFILGNIRNKSLEEIWSHPKMMELRKIKPTDIQGVCKKCKYLDFCMGGCRARAYLENGNFLSSNPICESFYRSKLFPINSISKKS